MPPTQAVEENGGKKRNKYVTWISLLLIWILVHVRPIKLSFLNWSYSDYKESVDCNKDCLLKKKIKNLRWSTVMPRPKILSHLFHTRVCWDIKSIMSHLSYCCLGFFMNIVISYLYVLVVRAANLCITDLILRLQRTKINEDKIFWRRETYSEE